ncbi:hypothetical protein F5H01DRAFT_337419 [Linnemannia elongata]|nr:hypothetical protein F5H01DRAFT_337419 [Linnemannia elongata]
MTNKRTQFDTSIKSIPGSQYNRRTRPPQRQPSFHDTNDPAATPIRSPSPTAPAPERDSTPENEAANSTFTQGDVVDFDSNDDEKPTLTLQYVPDRPVQEDLSRSTQPAQVGQFLARLEIYWNETVSELTLVGQKANDLSLPQEHLQWYRKRCADLQNQERSLRDDIRRFTPPPPTQMDHHLAAYQEALAAYREALRLYGAQPSRD